MILREDTKRIQLWKYLTKSLYSRNIFKYVEAFLNLRARLQNLLANVAKSGNLYIPIFSIAYFALNHWLISFNLSGFYFSAETTVQCALYSHYWTTKDCLYCTHWMYAYVYIYIHFVGFMYIFKKKRTYAKHV